MKALSVLFVCLAAIALLFAQADPQAGDARPPVIRAIDFKHFQPVKVEEILQRLKAKGVRLTVEHPLDSQEVVVAQEVLEGLLAENGRPGARVNAEVAPMPPRSVKITFTAVAP
jgi:outer membrane protein assembly factor BamA